MTGSGWEALQDVRKWSGVTPGCLPVVESQSRMSGSGREPPGYPGGRDALPDVQEKSRGPPRCQQL